jgi:hypothetical protein
LEKVTVGGTVDTTPSHLLVSFTQYIDGIPLTGPGDKFGVRISDNGEIARALIWHPELMIQGNIQCIDANQAYNSLIMGNKEYAVPTDCQEVIITNIYIGYYLEYILEGQEFVMPVYVFKGECFDSDGL